MADPDAPPVAAPEPGAPPGAGGEGGPQEPPTPSLASDAPALATGGAMGTKRRGPRPHPYRHEVSPQREMALDPVRVTLLWLGIAVGLAVAGFLVSSRYSTIVGTTPVENWKGLTLVPLFGGLALLVFGWREEAWARRATMAGWLLFGSYWSLTASDLFVAEGQDYVNYTFAVLGVFFFTYLAYHEWLSVMRGVPNATLRFLNISTFVAAGSYFLIDKIQWLRVGLIRVVSDHTKWMLDLFGQGDRAGLVFITDRADNKSPTTFFYPEQYCEPAPARPDAVGEYCRDHGYSQHITVVEPGASWWDQLLHYTPDGDHAIVPVSIILACTALQSIMLFVGLFAGTRASLGKKVKASLVVAAAVYVLNLVRNTGIIWFYGQGHASFWVMHNAIGKGGSLVAFVLIAMAVFRWLPEFLEALVGVIDLPHRDGPIERMLRLGRRRPEADQATERPPVGP